MWDEGIVHAQRNSQILEEVWIPLFIEKKIFIGSALNQFKDHSFSGLKLPTPAGKVFYGYKFVKNIEIF